MMVDARLGNNNTLPPSNKCYQNVFPFCFFLNYYVFFENCFMLYDS